MHACNRAGTDICTLQILGLNLWARGHWGKQESGFLALVMCAFRARIIQVTAILSDGGVRTLWRWKESLGVWSSPKTVIMVAAHLRMKDEPTSLMRALSLRHVVSLTVIRLLVLVSVVSNSIGEMHVLKF
jgi:uncharacterized membrane protein (DUF4010 family)